VPALATRHPRCGLTVEGFSIELFLLLYHGLLPPSTAVSDFDRLSLVVVDDDDDVRKALRRLLQSLGHEVRVFGSAEELEVPGHADCLIVDVRLPGATGLELRDRIRMSGSPIPIVLITGDAGPSALDGTAGVTLESLAKPFDETELIAAIKQAVFAAQDVQ
jgi:FixJ family two-component response regulator